MPIDNPKTYIRKKTQKLKDINVKRIKNDKDIQSKKNKYNVEKFKNIRI